MRTNISNTGRKGACSFSSPLAPPAMGSKRHNLYFTNAAAVAPHLEAFLYDVRSALQEDLRGLHLEMLRELEAQRHEMRCLLLDESREVVSLRRENEELRRRMEEMRGPMGGLAQWAEEEEGA